MMETILCAAIYYDNGIHYPHQSTYGIKTGFVLAGYRHPNIIGVLPTNIKFKNLDDEHLTIEWNENCPKHIIIQGFITSSGRFVDREEAAQIALHSGQIKELKFGSELYSEDLY